jgi:hypothetical protein
MPRLAYGLATRTHGVRPSEKTAPGVIPGFPPLGRPSSDSPPRGGAGSARPQYPHRDLPRHLPIWPPASCRIVRDHVMPGFTSSLATRTHGVRPSEKTAPGVIPGFAPLGHPSSDGPPRGGAGSARPRNVGMVPYRCIPHRATEDPSTLPGQ